MKRFLGVDGGGSKTAFLLIDETGRLLAAHNEGPAYHVEVGLEGLRATLARGIEAVLGRAALKISDLDYAFFGLPAYGEDSSLIATLDATPSAVLSVGRYRCGNDALCGWSGALGGADGINVIAGTGSMAYGEYRGRSARAGGWGELFGDEGSAHWVVREGLSLFSRMSDGRSVRGALHERVRRHFALRDDLDLCAALYGKAAGERSQLAGLAFLVAEAAVAGDDQARAIFGAAAAELAQLIHAVHDQLRVPHGEPLPVSYSGGLFELRELLLAPLRSQLSASGRSYQVVAPRFSPAAGAALYAAQLGASPLGAAALARLELEDGARRSAG
jgi:N-acetylglucosamine kinase-like BadF-type ATPase